MSSYNIFILVNSLILTVVGVLLGIIGFFFKDLHRDFKTLVDRVNNLYTELTRHTTQTEGKNQKQEEDYRDLKSRVKALEKGRRVK